MVGISKLYCNAIETSDVLRYGRKSNRLPSHLLQFSEDKKPVVVFNCTKMCNLKCVHCYSGSDGQKGTGELSTEQAKHLIDDLHSFGSPVLLFSGGEPLMRADILTLLEYTVSKGMRAVLSTNGTLITRETAEKLAKLGLSYVGVSLDGLEETHDSFRMQKGAFEKALRGISNCLEHRIKVGIRFTINSSNYHQIPGLFALLEEYKIPRICFYHLVTTGRAGNLTSDRLTLEQTRQTVDTIIDKTRALYDKGLKPEVLTVDNHCDGPYLYLRMLREQHPGAEEVFKLLQYNRGNSSGVGIGCVSWDGEVYPDQFHRTLSLGNVTGRPFSTIWTDLDNPVLKKLKHKKEHVTGRCSDCKYLDICAGNFRARAEALTGDLWASDPACYLTDDEIGL